MGRNSHKGVERALASWSTFGYRLTLARNSHKGVERSGGLNVYDCIVVYDDRNSHKGVESHTSNSMNTEENTQVLKKLP